MSRLAHVLAQVVLPRAVHARLAQTPDERFPPVLATAVCVPAAEVRPYFVKLAKSWPTWESYTHEPPITNGEVHFSYDGEYSSERVLILSGSGTLVPDV